MVPLILGNPISAAMAACRLHGFFSDSFLRRLWGFRGLGFEVTPLWFHVVCNM